MRDGPIIKHGIANILFIGYWWRKATLSTKLSNECPQRLIPKICFQSGTGCLGRQGVRTQSSAYLVPGDIITQLKGGTGGTFHSCDTFLYGTAQSQEEMLFKIYHTVNRLRSSLSLGHSVTRSLSHSVTRSLNHLVTQSLSHTQSHSITQSLNHLVTQSLSHYFQHWYWLTDTQH